MRSGTQVGIPVPSYSNLLGVISACVGRTISHKDTRIGFEFRCVSSDLELERTERWQVDDKGILRPHAKGQGLVRRQVYFFPLLDLYLTNLSLKESFEAPASTPTLGRSQDIATIKFVRQIDLQPVESGLIGPTLIPFPQKGATGLVIRLPEWFDNERKGRTRHAGPFGLYTALISTTAKRFPARCPDLYHPSDAEQKEGVIYLHKWLT